MESLPVELLIQIFGSFCFHCQNPGLFPNADLDHVRRDKKVLAYLCRTSKSICSVAQPILYHYYATGNSRISITQPDGLIGFPHEADFLPHFVRTIVQRPDLASRVTTMHIVEMNSLLGYQTELRTINSLFEFSISRNLLKSPDLPDDWLDGDCRKWPVDKAINLHRWLATLAAILCPRLNSLYLNINTDAQFNALEDSPHIKLPSLRTLGLMSHVIDYHFSELEALYTAAPNLETIYAIASSGWVSLIWVYLQFKVRLPNVKTLAISDMVSSDLKCLLRCVPKLEVLEYYWDDVDQEKDYQFTGVEELLEPVRTTVRRLCFEFLPRGAHFDPFPQWVEPPVVDYPPIRSLREFPRLEHLSIDCFLLYRGTDHDDANRLIDLLPRSIRFLRISYVYRGINSCLRQLASHAPKELPFLKEIVLGIAERMNPRYDVDIESSIALKKEFEASGIGFTLSYDILGAHPRTVIPGDVVAPNVTPVPRIADEMGYRDVDEHQI